ncbi:peptidoglycan-binding protein LysM [Pseudohalioglobus sediminis]|uniref:Potassium binding protein Kbp n=1 Tax=Pseudohalioglobus sediminis TaxID=2606449 RepID=A0A5B0WZL6_9GAMM|nr:peptidoglycan-binding protein LysM [Pseudohalioglobus sediminis]KAA1191845.1 peptidoglycan-binding protein LysM [Pseudohalioglobus sediminis]
MGMFDFIKDAGEALAEKAMGSTTNEDLTASTEVSPERLNQLRSEQIEKAIAQLDIDGEQVDVSVNDSVAVLKGSAPSQEAMEKMVLCAGNQYGIDKVDCQLEVPAQETPAAEPAAAPATTAPAAASSTFYTVKSGDTLGKIAQEHYGAASKYMAIFEANQPMLSDPDKIYPGQQLRIPAL